MSEAAIPIGLLDTILAIVSGMLFTLVGIIYRRLRQRIADIEENLGELEEQTLKTKRDIDTSHTLMFGRDEDSTNNGVVAELDEINVKLERLIDVLQREDELDFERDDIRE